MIRVLIDRHIKKGRKWKSYVICECGKEFDTSRENLIRRGIKSCGCLTRQIISDSKRTRTLSERFYEKIDKSEGCWLWKGSINQDGYGRMMTGSRLDNTHRQNSAHRISYEVHFGKIPTGLSVLHKCDVRNCANPDHLYLGTQKDNMRDAVQRGRWEKQRERIREWIKAHPTPSGKANPNYRHGRYVKK